MQNARRLCTSKYLKSPCAQLNRAPGKVEEARRMKAISTEMRKQKELQRMKEKVCRYRKDYVENGLGRKEEG